jgi:TonB family protein
MNRIHKKCFVASLGVHALLLAILFVGPAFLSSPDLPVPEPIDFIPSRLVDEAVSGGGNPNARPPEPQPVKPQPVRPTPVAPPPEPRPEPEVKKAPEPVVKKAPEPVKAEPESLEVTKKHVPKINLEVKTAKNQPKTKAPDTKAQERAEQEARQRLANAIQKAAGSISRSTASATTIEEIGPGGGGPAYASYASEVQRVYREAWAPPEDTVNDNAVVRARVTIRHDGRVTDARVISASGDIQVDNSVKFTLERVKFIAPFPEGAKDKERTYIIKFDLKVKRGLA